MFNDIPAQKNPKTTNIGYWVSEKGKCIKWLYNVKMKSIKKNSVKSSAMNTISQFSSFKILNKIQNLLKNLKLIQDGKIKYEGVSKMSENSMLEAVKNCLIRRPKVRIALGLASNNFIYLLSNTALCAGCFGNAFILVLQR